MFWPRVGTWFIARVIFLAFQLSSLVFSIALRTWLGLPHPSIASIPWCVCTHPIDPMGIHFLFCAYNNKCTRTHDVIHDTFVTITWNVGFHVGWEQLHVLLSTTFNSSHWQVNIVLTKDGISTLVNLVIAYPPWANLFPQFCETQGFATFDVVQAKERSYYNGHPTKQFLPLVIEVFGCLHNHVNVFLHNCANSI
jgi:hypothetical protein